VLRENNIASTASKVVEIIGPFSASSVTAINITYAPSTTYYCKVRARLPIATPWSAARSFSVEPVSPMAVSRPAPGSNDMPVKGMTLVWTALPGVSQYQISIDTSVSFEVPMVFTTISAPFYVMEEDLKYSTTYYWRVRPLGGADEDWLTSVFITEAEPVPEEPAEPTQIIVEPAPQAQAPIVNVAAPSSAIPSYLLWMIIVIGAVLVIALIVLIVRTRRVV